MQRPQITTGSQERHVCEKKQTQEENFRKTNCFSYAVKFFSLVDSCSQKLTSASSVLRSIAKCKATARSPVECVWRLNWRHDTAASAAVYAWAIIRRTHRRETQSLYRLSLENRCYTSASESRSLALLFKKKLRL